MRDLGPSGTADAIARAEQRFRVMLPALLLTRGGRREGMIGDLSRGGARIEIEESLVPGESVILLRGALQVEGRIAWVCGRAHGLIFDAPIRATQLLVQMSESRRRAVP